MEKEGDQTNEGRTSDERIGWQFRLAVPGPSPQVAFQQWFSDSGAGA